MTATPDIAPLTVEFDVTARTEDAFAAWVEHTDLWWPRAHTVSGAPSAIVFEPRPGGRIYERDAHGAEHAWGEVLIWAPPLRVEYLWHLFFARAEATRVAVTFTPTASGTTVRLVQTGWDALGEQGRPRRERTVQGWATVTAAFRRHIETTEEIKR